MKARQRVSARKQRRIARARQTSSKNTSLASQYINHLTGETQYKAVILFDRVSTPEQKDHSKDRIRFLRATMQKFGIPVDREFTCVHTGTTTDYKEIKRAFRYAEKTGLPLAAVSTDRFVRNRNYRSNVLGCMDLLPGKQELDELWKNAGWADLYTVFHPDEDPREVRRQVSLLGQKKKTGRPVDKTPGYMKRLKERQLPQVIELYDNGNGMSIRAIARKFERSPDTIRRWVIENGG